MYIIEMCNTYILVFIAYLYYSNIIYFIIILMCQTLKRECVYQKMWYDTDIKLILIENLT